MALEPATGTTKMPSWRMPKGIEALRDYIKCLIFCFDTLLYYETS